MPPSDWSVVLGIITVVPNDESSLSRDVREDADVKDLGRPHSGMRQDM